MITVLMIRRVSFLMGCPNFRRRGVISRESLARSRYRCITKLSSLRYCSETARARRCRCRLPSPNYSEEITTKHTKYTQTKGIENLRTGRVGESGGLPVTYYRTDSKCCS